MSMPPPAMVPAAAQPTAQISPKDGSPVRNRSRERDRESSRRDRYATFYTFLLAA